MLGSAPLGGAPLGAPLALSAGPVSVDVVMLEGVDVHDAEVFVRPVFGTTTEGFTLTSLTDMLLGSAGVREGVGIYAQPQIESALAQMIAIVERVRHIDSAAGIRGWPALAAENIQIADTLVGYYGMVVLERLRFLDTMLGASHFNALLSDVATIGDQLLTGLPAGIVDGVGISTTMSAQTVITMLEAIKVSAVHAPAGRFNITVAQIMRLRDSLGNFFGAQIDEQLGIASALIGTALARAQVSEALVIADALVPQLLIALTVADGVEVDDTQIVKMLFQPTMLEGVEISAGHVEPDGTFSTWAVNTRSGAVSEYTNFAFNSMAQVGSRALAASETGLYELLGDNDAGTPIIARIKGGYLQFGGTKLSRLKEAYIAARGDGDWVLRVLTGDGVTYNYAVSNRSMRSTKFHMGKGQRARYFAYELISAGQDFDLDTLEFVPIVVQRRV